MYDFSDQVALVTGASRGIGRKVAEELARYGAKVLLASRSVADLETVAKAVVSAGGEAVTVQMDVGDPAQIRGAFLEIWKHSDRIDILVNNAGITRDNLLLRMKEKEWRDVMSTNLDSLYFVTREVVSKMFRQRYGRIVNVASVVGQSGNPGQVNYVSSKAGMIGFTKALAREVASRNITVNAVSPGFIETEMTSGLAEETRQYMLKNIPLQQLGNVEDVARGVLFLASRETRYITGHVLNINGGLYM